MAPVKKKRVWNFSLDVPLGGVSRKQRKFIHTAVRNLVLQRRKSLDRQIESEVRDNLRVHSAAAWQQIRHISPSSETERLQRLAAVDALIARKGIIRTALNALNEKLECSSDGFRNQELLEFLRDSERSFSRPKVPQQPFNFLHAEFDEDVGGPGLSSTHSSINIEAALQEEDENKTTAWWSEIYEEIRIHEELEQRLKEFLLNTAAIPQPPSWSALSPFPLPPINSKEEDAITPSERRKATKNQQRKKLSVGSLQQEQPIDSEGEHQQNNPQQHFQPQTELHQSNILSTVYPSSSIPFPIVPLPQTAPVVRSIPAPLSTTL